MKPRAPQDLGARGAGASPEALGYAKPRSYEELRAVLASGTIHFPKRLRQVAIYLWQHPSDVAVSTIGEVAEQAGVQPSTLVRFAQSLGFTGFSELQGLFKDHVKGSWPDARAREAAEAGGDLHFLDGLVAASQASLARLGTLFDAAAFERMTAILAEGDLIYVVGSKRAFPVAAYVSLALAQQGLRNTLVDNVGSTALDQMGCAGARGWSPTPAERVMQGEVLGRGPGWLETAAAAQPFGRLLAAEEVANLAVFLLSDAAGPMTGALVDQEQWVVGAPA